MPTASADDASFAVLVQACVYSWCASDRCAATGQPFRGGLVGRALQQRQIYDHRLRHARLPRQHVRQGHLRQRVCSARHRDRPDQWRHVHLQRLRAQRCRYRRSGRRAALAVTPIGTPDCARGSARPRYGPTRLGRRPVGRACRTTADFAGHRLRRSACTAARHFVKAAQRQFHGSAGSPCPAWPTASPTPSASRPGTPRASARLGAHPGRDSDRVLLLHQLLRRHRHRQPAPAPKPPSTYYANCDAVRAAGKAPLRTGAARLPVGPRPGRRRLRLRRVSQA